MTSSRQAELPDNEGVVAKVGRYFYNTRRLANSQIGCRCRPQRQSGRPIMVNDNP